MTPSAHDVLSHAVGHVVVADDVDANRLLLRDHVELQGHKVTEATNGKEALQVIRSANPDVVLLDIQMPEMDGIEVCRALKSDPGTAMIPVLLVTALGSREHRLEGMSAGANDFVTKPVDSTDLVLRVRNAISMRQIFSRLERQYETLRELERLRDGLVHMVVHDIRSPLAALLMNTQMLHDAVGASGEDAETLHDIERLATRISGLVSDVLDVSRMESQSLTIKPALVDMHEIIDSAIRSVATDDVLLDVDVGVDLPSTSGDEAMLERVAVNLLDNAVSHSSLGSPIAVRVRSIDDRLVLTIKDHGPGIAPEHREKIFEKFAQVSEPSMRRRSSGLGLTFCKLAVEAHGGTIGVHSALGEGCEFWVTLPLVRATVRT